MLITIRKYLGRKMKKNILVIGGGGYVGSHQVRMLCDAEYSVSVIDNLNTGFESAIDERAHFEYGDIRDFDFVCKVLKKYSVDVVIHFAALSLVGESTKRPLEYYNNNVYGMEILLRAMEICDVTKIVFSSSAAVYGEHLLMPITEEYETNPVSPYGQTKLIMEKMILDQSNAANVNYISLRYFNVAGASIDGKLGECHNPETHLIPLVIKAAMNNTAINIYGDNYDTKDGTCVRDYIHVLDLCKAHELAIEYLLENNKNHILNLGYGNGFSVSEIVEEVEKYSKKKIKKVISEKRHGDPAKLVASNKRIQNVLGWIPEYADMHIIVKTAYDFYEKYPSGYKEEF